MTTTEIQHRATASTHRGVDHDETSVDFTVQAFRGPSTVHGRSELGATATLDQRELGMSGGRLGMIRPRQRRMSLTGAGEDVD